MATKLLSCQLNWWNFNLLILWIRICWKSVWKMPFYPWMTTVLKLFNGSVSVVCVPLWRFELHFEWQWKPKPTKILPSPSVSRRQCKKNHYLHEYIDKMYKTLSLYSWTRPQSWPWPKKFNRNRIIVHSTLFKKFVTWNAWQKLFNSMISVNRLCCCPTNLISSIDWIRLQSKKFVVIFINRFL